LDGGDKKEGTQEKRDKDGDHIVKKRKEKKGKEQARDIIRTNPKRQLQRKVTMRE